MLSFICKYFTIFELKTTNIVQIITRITYNVYITKLLVILPIQWYSFRFVFLILMNYIITLIRADVSKTVFECNEFKFLSPFLKTGVMFACFSIEGQIIFVTKQLELDKRKSRNISELSLITCQNVRILACFQYFQIRSFLQDLFSIYLWESNSRFFSSPT